MKFSQRLGIVPVKSRIQVDDIDEELDKRLWNIFLDSFFLRIPGTAPPYEESQRGKVCRAVWKSFFLFPIDEIPTKATGSVYCDGVLKRIKAWYSSCQWYEAYEFLEFLAQLNTTIALPFVNDVNIAMEEEVSAYRLINNSFIRITSDTEIETIQSALSDTSQSTTINTHLETALNFLSDRKQPDYRNSIKESISAVEALCIVITNNKKASLGNALSQIEQSHPLPKALKASFSALYGYTSDSGGIRHALIDNDSEVSFEEAKFMLVSCSAFINYLRSLAKIE